ncbi:DHS-like NAD/FAD-binding domain-containing protein [Schizophyllum commune H4-8]|nr:DHS-like NAD/FAD-binding domain-containing protein [Schizophyllum commune H4-8]KAI5897137.1 DHS-like NAD/FAD-binding domain-containing protein [Schizophyllum commune H4-8]
MSADQPPPAKDDAAAFRAKFRASKNIIVIAGAGLSAASGIPTFRDGGGMWRSLDAQALATPVAFEANPALVWQFYHYRRTTALSAKPNPAHKILAKMSIPTELKKVAPQAKSFHLITQNVDRLSPASTSKPRRSPPSVFPRSILEMHGRLFDVRCTDSSCGHVEEDRSTPLTPALGAAEAGFSATTDADSGRLLTEIPRADLPRCRKCGALARPGVVWFGERPYFLDEINGLVFRADMCLVVGTSATVRPASTYAYRVHRHGGTVAIFNREPSEADERADFRFRGGCEEVLPELFKELANQQAA